MIGIFKTIKKNRKPVGKWLLCQRIRMCKKILYTNTENEK